MLPHGFAGERTNSGHMAFKNPFRSSNKTKTAMDNQNVKNDRMEEQAPDLPIEETREPATADIGSVDERTELETLQAELDILRVEHQAVHDKHVRLFAEFDNFRKRTAKEKLEMLQIAGAGALKNILPVLDDMERAIAINTNVQDIAVVKQGMELIHQKFVNLLQTQGVKRIEAKGTAFDPDLHEAITKAPAPSPDLKGKVIEVLENGYTMNDKVIRYAKVVVGE